MAFNYSYQKPIVISEIGANHKGSIDIAKELILLSKQAGCNIAKFQKRTPKELLTKEQYKAPHPNPHHAYGATYGEHREFLEFTQEQHAELKKYAESLNIEYSTSVWDVTSAKEMVALSPKFLKVPSACNNHYEMLKILRDDYKGDVHVSFGMTSKLESEDLVKFFEETGVAKNRLVIYACTSGYPVPFEDISLLEINNLYNKYDTRVKSIGFSGHHLGIAIDVAAYTLGAVYIERHFTKDRSWKGTDHAASLEPTGMTKLCRDLNNTYKALTFKKSEILEIEKEQREKLKYRAK
ncbi:N-acetylneuraminate synthase [Candidatus Hepatincola sp. Pdp]